jgi:hypothetical protein
VVGCIQGEKARPGGSSQRKATTTENLNLVVKAQYIIIYFIPNIHIKSTTFENERTRLIFEGGGDSGGGGISKEQPPMKMSIHGLFSRVAVVLARSIHPRK